MTRCRVALHLKRKQIFLRNDLKCSRTSHSFSGTYTSSIIIRLNISYQANEQEWFHFSRMAQIREHAPIINFAERHAIVHKMA